MSKKYTFLCILFLTCSFFCFTQTNTPIKGEKVNEQIIFKLPYPKAMNHKRYFQDTVNSALIIESMIINDEVLHPIPDYTLYFLMLDEYKTQKISNKIDSVYINMTWKKNWDGSLYFPYKGNKYVVNQNSEVTVIYRIVYPFPFGNAEKLYQGKFDQNKYLSDCYSITISIDQFEGDTK